MASFNHIPDHLRDDEQADWTPALGLRRGAACTALASLGLAGAFGAIGYLVPFLTRGFILNFATGFLIAFALLSVVQKTANMFDPKCTLIAVLGVLPPLMANQIGIALNVATSTETSLADTWAAHGYLILMFSDYPAYLGTAVIAWLCRNGDYSLMELVDFLMINPFTGRHV